MSGTKEDRFIDIRFVEETPDAREYNFLGSVHRGIFNFVSVNPSLEDLFNFLLLDRTEIHTRTGLIFLAEERGWFSVYASRKELELVAVRGAPEGKYKKLVDDMEKKATL